MNFLATLLPSLGPAFTALINPWIILFFVLSVGGAFFYGKHDEHQKFEYFENSVRAAGDAQNARTAERIAKDNLAKKESDDEFVQQLVLLNNDIDGLTGALKRLSGNDSRRSFLPTVPPGTPMPSATSTNLTRLDSALQDYNREIREAVSSSGTEVAGLIIEGANNAIALKCGSDWADRQSKMK